MAGPIAAFIPSIISGVGTVFGAHMASSAAKSGQKLQKQATDEALKYEKERDRYATATEANRYGALMQGISPYISSGGSADARMAALLGLPAPSATSPAPPTYPTPPIPGEPSPPGQVVPRPPLRQRIHEIFNPPAPSADQAPSPGGGAPSGPTGMVTMQSPKGTVKQVPASEQAYWEARGGKKVA